MFYGYFVQFICKDNTSILIYSTSFRYRCYCLPKCSASGLKLSIDSQIGSHPLKTQVKIAPTTTQITITTPKRFTNVTNLRSGLSLIISFAILQMPTMIQSMIRSPHPPRWHPHPQQTIVCKSSHSINKPNNNIPTANKTIIPRHPKHPCAYSLKSSFSIMVSLYSLIELSLNVFK